MPPRSCKSIAIGSTFLVLSIATLAAGQDLNRGEVISDRLLTQPREKQVLIYIANEPDEEMARKLQQWTTELDDAEVRRAGERLGSDVKQFLPVVDREFEAMLKFAPAKCGVVVFTNEFAREKLYYTRLWEGVVEVEVFDRPDSERVDLQRHPMSDPAVFAAALKVAAERFDPAEHDFILVTKSHGTPEAAMVTMFGHVMHAASPEELMQLIDEKRREAKEAQEKLIAGKLANGEGADVDGKADGLDKDMGLNKDMTLGQENESTLSMENESTLAGKALITGMSKEVYFQTLAEAHRKLGMRFNIVFMEACRSELDAPQAARLLNSQPEPFIGMLYASDRTGLRYSTIDYQKLFEEAKEHNRSLVAEFRHYLDEFQRTQVPIPLKGELPPK